MNLAELFERLLVTEKIEEGLKQVENGETIAHEEVVDYFKKKWDTQSEKLKLIEWLIALQDPTTIEKIKFLRDNQSETSDWWDTLTEAEKESIDRGLDDIENGRTVPHSEVRKKYGKWL